MNDTQKMLQAIIHGQNALKQELVAKIDKLRARLDEKIDSLEARLEAKISKVERNLIKLTKRIDNLGRQLAYLEDDAPTREEFDNLSKRVEKMEQGVVQHI